MKALRYILLRLSKQLLNDTTVDRISTIKYNDKITTSAEVM